MPRFTLTARHEGKWRWAAVHPEDEDISNEAVIKLAMIIIDEKSQDEDPVEAHLWSFGGCTLADPSGYIIWTRPVQADA